jgi:DNA-directed RNA polymerase subunit H
MDEESNDVSQHVLVPKHEKLTEEEVETLLGDYKIAVKQLPKIKVSDPALENFEIEEGDVIRIKRQSPTIGEVDYYRMVVNG